MRAAALRSAPRAFRCTARLTCSTRHSAARPSGLDSHGWSGKVWVESCSEEGSTGKKAMRVIVTYSWRSQPGAPGAKDPR